MTLKQYSKEYNLALKKVILSKPEFHIWTPREILDDVNKILSKRLRLIEAQIPYLFRGNKSFLIYKHFNKDRNVTYIFKRTKKCQ